MTLKNEDPFDYELIIPSIGKSLADLPLSQHSVLLRKEQSLNKPLELKKISELIESSFLPFLESELEISCRDA